MLAMTRVRLALLSLIASMLFIGSTSPAQATTTVGSGACAATVDASAGVSSFSSGNKCFITFSSVDTHTWTAPSSVTNISLFIIAGGGAGGAGAWGGGGGAGGLVYDSSYSVTPGSSYSLVVGRGGTVGGQNLTPTTNRSNNGTNSWFNLSSFAAIGGGAGASYAYGDNTQINGQNTADGSPGGSGGGATENSKTGNTYGGVGGTSSQAIPTGADLALGNSGGTTLNAGSNMSGGGGGGAGGVGASNTTSQVAGAGGVGATYTNLSIIDTIGAVTSFGQLYNTHYYFAGGGGGGSAGTKGAGGYGGGGAGGDPSNTYTGQNGAANTGGGGGGASYSSGCYPAGAGGSGLVVIIYSGIITTSVSAAFYSGSGSGIYRSVDTITATLTGTDAKVTFLADGKAIPGCKSIMSSGLIARCPWKPAGHRTIQITVQVIAGVSSTASSTSAAIRVLQRSGTR